MTRPRMPARRLQSRGRAFTCALDMSQVAGIVRTSKGSGTGARDMLGRIIGKLGTMTLLAGLVGCNSSGPNLRTPMPEQYVLPPSDDARFSQPVSYPKETLNQEPIKPASTQGKLPSQQPQLGPGMGGGRGITPGGY